MERNDRPATPEEVLRLTRAGFVADNTDTLTTWARSASGVSMTTEEALLLVDAEDKRRRADRLVALVSGGSRSVENAEVILREIDGQRVPQSRCPKCGAIPLADNEDALLCEPCNAWYSRKPLPAGAEAVPERPATDFEISVAMSRQPGPKLRPALPDDVRFELERDASLFGEGVAVLLHEAWQRIAPTNVVILKRARRPAAPPSNADNNRKPAPAPGSGDAASVPAWSDLTDREAQAIAREAGCDVRVVQLALQGRDGVRDDIRARVLDVAPRIRQAAPAASTVNFREEAMRIVAARLAGREGADLGVVMECCEKAPFDDMAREVARVQRALEATYQRGFSARNVPPAAIPLNAAQLRALAESDEAGDAPFVATTSALREMVAAQLGWQVQMPVFDADGTRRAERWTVMVPAAGPAAVPGASRARPRRPPAAARDRPPERSMMTDPKTFTLAELLLHATEFQWDGLTIAAIVEDPSSAKTVEPKIYGWNVIDTAAGNWLRTDGKWDSGPDIDDYLDEFVDEPLAEQMSREPYQFPTYEAAFAAAVAYRDEQARRGL